MNGFHLNYLFGCTFYRPLDPADRTGRTIRPPPVSYVKPLVKLVHERYVVDSMMEVRSHLSLPEGEQTEINVRF